MLPILKQIRKCRKMVKHVCAKYFLKLKFLNDPICLKMMVIDISVNPPSKTFLKYFSNLQNSLNTFPNVYNKILLIYINATIQSRIDSYKIKVHLAWVPIQTTSPPIGSESSQVLIVTLVSKPGEPQLTTVESGPTDWVPTGCPWSGSHLDKVFTLGQSVLG